MTPFLIPINQVKPNCYIHRKFRLFFLSLHTCIQPYYSSISIPLNALFQRLCFVLLGCLSFVWALQPEGVNCLKEKGRSRQEHWSRYHNGFCVCVCFVCFDVDHF